MTQRELDLLKQVITAAIAALILAIVVRSLLPGAQAGLPRPTSTSFPTREITANDLSLGEAWQRTIGPIHSGWTKGTTLSSHGILVLPVFGDGTQLIALDTLDGETLWTQKLVTPQYPDDPNRIDSLFVDDDKVYIAVPFVIKAFLLVDGQPLWTTRDLEPHTGYDIYPTVQEGILQVYSKKDKLLIYDVDVTSGAIQSISEYPREVFLKTSSAEYRDDMNHLVKASADTHEPIWQSPAKGSINGWPVLVDPDIMIVMTGNYLHKLIAIDVTTGQVVWQMPKEAIVSNFVIADDIIYSIEAHATLSARELSTGRIIGQIKFSGGDLDVNHGLAYTVIVDDAVLLIYLGDSQDLFAFNRNSLDSP